MFWRHATKGTYRDHPVTWIGCHGDDGLALEIELIKRVYTDARTAKDMSIVRPIDIFTRPLTIPSKHVECR